MKKKILMITIMIVVFLLIPKDIYAYSSSNYENRTLCGNYELASFKSDGTITKVSCHNTYELAKTAMKQNGADDLAIMAKVAGKTKIIDANVALLDLSVNPETLTYFYTNSELTSSAYTYMDTGSLYGGVDGAHIATAYSNAKSIWVAKVKIGNFTGWIRQTAYEIVPITWVKSSSSYTVTTDSIRHNYVAKIQNTYTGSAGSTIGPKPSMLATGKYYSYDGHYFYKDLKTLIKDYKNGNYNNSVNKSNPYYNYYMYLSNHTKTNYSSINIDEYIRNNLGIKQDAFGNATSNGSSRLYGKGNFFYYSQEKYGVNAILSLSLSRNETGNGRSNLAINKNNGFGLNAVDSSPTESANWYASFADSILGYASKWITYGYAHPRDWRYFGPQFGDKFIGMNVKYASDTYWSEKMAANYFSLDKALGLQDYNYYQLGVVTKQVNAMSDSNNSSKFVYSYPEAEDALVIVGEKQGESVNGNKLWYKVISDLNIDSNFNEVKSGNYNWNRYVYVPAAYVKKINTPKNGYKSPSDITEYHNKNYEYDLLVKDTVLQPKVGKVKTNSAYYYDSSLQSKTGKTLLKDRYVMVYAIAYLNGKPVSYLVTSDYKYDQKEWVNANNITLVKNNYGKVSVTVSGNQYTWVNSTTEDTKATLISGLYTNSYVPVLEQKTVSGYLWYKVPVNLTGTSNVYGWTLASAPGVSIKLSTSSVENNNPTITAVDKKIIQGTTFNVLEGIKATDPEDGDITKNIKVIENTVNIDKPGTYKVTYQITDSKNATISKTINVVVTENKKPVITAKDIEVKEQKEFNELKGVTATDEEDGDITKNIKVVNNTTDIKTPGTYEITYEVEDSYKQKVSKTVKVTIIDDKNPVINASDKIVTQGTTFNELKDVTAADEEDGDITKNIIVVENNINTKKIGKYKVIYEVIDSINQKTTKEIEVEVVENQKPTINAEDKVIYLDEEFNELKGIKATDPEDGDITKDIKVIKNTVNTKELGTYKVIYEVEDSFGNKVEKEITIKVEERKLQEKDGLYYFDYLKVVSNKLQIKGYHAIKGINHTKDENITFKIIFENIETGKEYVQDLTRITDKSEITRPVYSTDGKDYTYSWYKGNIDINQIKDGDYQAYIVTESKEYYAKTIVSNKVLKTQSATYTDEKTLTTRNNYRDDNIPLEFVIRSEKIAEKTANSVYNQYNQYRTFEFNKNKLHIKGTSYSIGMNLAASKSVTRKIIFENTSTYKKYTYDLGSITNGMYTVGSTLGDNLDKTRAWFDKEIDITNIPKGNYAIYISTSSNVSDYGELTELLQRSLDDVKLKYEDKEYTFKINNDLRYRIELNIK